VYRRWAEMREIIYRERHEKNEDEYWFFMLLDVSSFRVFWYLTHTCMDVWIKIHHHYCLLYISILSWDNYAIHAETRKKSGESWMKMERWKGCITFDMPENVAHFCKFISSWIYFKKYLKNLNFLKLCIFKLIFSKLKK
jgi:hypothetical protein